LCLGTLDDDACDSGRYEGDERDADHHLGAAEDAAADARGYNVAVADRCDGLESPPDRKTEGGEVGGIGDPHQGGTGSGKADECNSKPDHDGSSVDDSLDAALEQRRLRLLVRGSLARHGLGVQRTSRLPSRAYGGEELLSSEGEAREDAVWIRECRSWRNGEPTSAGSHPTAPWGR